jgi:hypothetical protein
MKMKIKVCAEYKGADGKYLCGEFEGVVNGQSIPRSGEFIQLPLSFVFREGVAALVRRAVHELEEDGILTTILYCSYSSDWSRSGLRLQYASELWEAAFRQLGKVMKDFRVIHPFRTRDHGFSWIEP